MADCTGKITANFVVDCENLPIAGLESNVVLINKEDIDYANTTISVTNRVLVTDLKLKAGKTGYRFSGVKQSNSKNWALVPKDNLPNKFSHVFNGVVFNPTALNKLQVANLALGAKYVIVVEQLWKGADNKEAFEVLGLDAGLILSEATNNSNENDNTISLVLSSQEGYEEPLMPKTLLETDYSATKTVFDNLFIEA